MSARHGPGPYPPTGPTPRRPGHGPAGLPPGVVGHVVIVQPEPSMGSLKRVAVWLVVSTVGSCGLGALVLGGVMYFSADMRDTTHAFLAEVRAGRHDRAYEQTSAAFRSRVSFAAFPAHLSAHAPSVARSSGEWINGFSGGSREQCMEVWLSGEGPFGASVYVILVDEAGTWRVHEVTEVEPSLCASD